MRPKILLFCGIMLALCLWLLLFQSHKLQQPNPKETTETLTNQQQPAQESTKLLTVEKIQASPLNVSPSPPLIPKDIENLRSNRIERSFDPWRTPIQFYGMVVDESSNPVAGAEITFDCNDLSEKGTSFYSRKSDANGMFSLTDVCGEGITVHVVKEGYYTSRQDRDNFEYAANANGIFVPDPRSPVIFYLHKKGQGAQLITSDYGIRPDFPVLVPRDGSPVTVNLLQKKIDVSGDLQISQTKPDETNWQQATNWSFHMSFSDGGFIETDDAFPFTAPETGYQTTVDLDFVKDSPSWATQFSKDYYIMFGQPPKYGLLHVDANIGQQTIFLKYAINPTGSRNLEPTH